MSDAAKKEPKREPLKVRPRKGVDRDALIDDISDRFSESLKYLGR